jgi:hypothetical protein
MRLYDISASIRAVTDTADELTEEQVAQLDALGLALEQKCDGIAALVRESEAEAKAFGEEMARLAALKQTAANKAERLKDYLKSCLEALQSGAGPLPRVDTGRFKIRLQANAQPTVTASVPPEDLPVWLTRQRLVVTLDREAVLEAHAAGAELPAGVAVARGVHLRIS